MKRLESHIDLEAAWEYAKEASHKLDCRLNEELGLYCTCGLNRLREIIRDFYEHHQR